MVLKPLEFSECLADTPWFRQNLHEHEVALEDAYKSIKNIETQCRELISCTRKLSLAQRAFAKTLTEFKIETVGTTQTDDERVIGNCLREFGKLINQVEEERTKILNEAESHYLEPLKKFRVEAIGRTLHEEKRKYEKESTKFYQSLEKHLHLSTMRKNDFREADAQLDIQQHSFCKASLQYVAEIQSVQERMKFEFVETLSSFLYSWLTFYHVGHVIHEDFKPFLDGVQDRVQKTKESYMATIAEAEELKEKMLKAHAKTTNAAGTVATGGSERSSTIKQGYVYMQEKSKLPKTIGRDVLAGKWTKYYCVYSKETRIFTMIPITATSKTDMKGALGLSVSFKLKECLRRSSDSIDKRFCFDLIADERPDVMTFQALSEEDRRQWIDAMDGKQTVYSPGAGPSTTTLQTQLDETGFEFVQACIAFLEERGIREQGLYRNCGVTSKVQKLMQLGLDKRKSNGDKLNFNDDEWEIKTISSAVKTFLRNLPEPLMTFEQHNLFINAAKMDDRRTRVDHIHYYVHKLPPSHKSMLEIVIRHLKRVADRCSENLMTVGNLGVCFGPTLLRPKEETMAAIMDIKFCNVVVEVLIAHCEQIFGTEPPKSIGQPCPPKPDHRSIHHESSHPVISLSERQADNGRHMLSVSATSSVPTTAPPRPRAFVPSSPAIRAHATASSTPSSLGSSNSHIYDVPPEVPSSSKLLPTYGAASSSAATTPTTPPSQSASLASTRIPATTAVSSSSSRAAPHCESSDSLNSLISGGSDSPKASASSKVSVESRAKVSTSYAPAYNPLACETIPRGGQQAVGGMPSTSTSSTISAPNHSSTSSSAQPMCATECPVQRISPMYSSLINPVVSLQPSRRVKTLYACTPDHESELSFQPGQIITNVYESKEEGWLVGTLNGKTGLIPCNYVEPLP
uniref:Rho GTPase-activating protein 26 n=2 Tax=Strongyloidea TaxID=27829 RepID=A0A7I4YAZ0_HAECO